jgi:hypothetical protein
VCLVQHMSGEPSGIVTHCFSQWCMGESVVFQLYGVTICMGLHFVLLQFVWGYILYCYNLYEVTFCIVQFVWGYILYCYNLYGVTFCIVTICMGLHFVLLQFVWGYNLYGYILYGVNHIQATWVGCFCLCPSPYVKVPDIEGAHGHLPDLP